MIGQYFDMDLKKIGYFAGFVGGAAVVTTLLFWGIMGFDRWRNDMTMASDLMTAAVNIPVNQPPVFNGSTSAGQFVCPVHGAVGLPSSNAAGTCPCPVCGQAMSFHGAGAGTGNMTLAAAAGG